MTTTQDEAPTTRRRSATRARLIRAAGELFDESGTTGAGVREVCERAGFTRGAFYSNFASMDELYLEVCDERAHGLLELIEHGVAAVVHDRSEAPDLEQAVEDVVRLLPLDPSWFAARCAFMAQAAARPAAATRLRRHHQVLAERLGPLGSAAVRAAGREPRVSESALGELMLSAYDGAMFHATVHPDRTHAFLREAITAVLRGASR